MNDSVLQTFKIWLMIGLISFGGPAGGIAIMYHNVVEKLRWLSPQKFNFAMNYCMMLPGPAAMQLSIYLGWLRGGVRGGLISGFGYVMPSITIMLALSLAYIQFSELPWVDALFEGVKPCVVAIIFYAVIKLGKSSALQPFHIAIAAAAFITVLLSSFPMIAVMAIAALIAVVRDSILPQNQPNSVSPQSESSTGTFVSQLKSSRRGQWIFFLKALGIIAFLWLLPWLTALLCSSDFDFWNSLIGTFTKASLISFGGAYAVIPYIAEMSIHKFQWITEAQLIDGLALGESTPGPLVKVLTFVGFMAADDHFNSSILFSLLGFLCAAYYTFMPCFAFIFLGAPLINQFENNHRIKSALKALTAAVLGLMLQLGVSLAIAVVDFASNAELSYAVGLQFAWMLTMLGCLTFRKLSIPLALLASGAYGFLVFYLLL